MTEPVYRVADLEVLRAGGDQALVYARDTGTVGYYRPDAVELLTSCQQFRTIEEHLQARPATAVPPATLRRELLRMVRAGLLIGYHELNLADQPPTAPPPISAICLPTRDRPEPLRRAIASYAAHNRRHGRSVRFVVADDSTASDTRQSLAELAGQLSIEIDYAGHREKLALAERISADGQIPIEVVRFGCLGDPQAGPAIGANRNCLLLLTAGESILSADDDTVAELSRPPDWADGIELDSTANPLQLWYFNQRDQAIASAGPTAADLLSLHERYLGVRPATVLAAEGEPASFDRADPALVGRLRRRPGRIRITATGSVGDCGWDNRSFYLFQQSASHRRLISSAEQHRMARSSRELIQAVQRTTITGRPDPKFAMCVGLDNSELLAPFPPVGRAEEVAFAAVLDRCFPDSYGALLPYLIQHQAAGVRQFANAPNFSIGLSSWLPSCLASFDAGLDRDPERRLDRLGRYLVELAELPALEFDEFVRIGVWDSMSALVTQLSERLADADPPPDYWARDAQQLIAELRRDALAPADELYAAIGGRAALQRLLRRFGELLNWWPAITASARRLRETVEPLAARLA